MPEGTLEQSKRQAFIGRKSAFFLILQAFVISWV